MDAIRTFECYLVEGKLYGYEIDHKPYPASTDGYELSYFLPGKNAAFCIVSNDRGVNRSLAIHYAKAIYEGKYTVHTVDLSVINDKRKW